jgi:hypothetical protein
MRNNRYRGQTVQARRPMTPFRFASKCAFFVRNGQMHGRCVIQLRDGSHVTIETRPGQGVPMSLLTHSLAMRETEGEVGGIFGDVWKGAKKAAGGIATGKVAVDLLKTASTVARSDLGSVALSFVPGGTAVATAVKLGTQAADLLGKAEQGSREAKEKILKVTQLAAQGNPVAIQAHVILKAVHAKGKAKGVFPIKGKARVVKVSPKKHVASKVVTPRRAGRLAPPAPRGGAPYPTGAQAYQGTYRAGLNARVNPLVYGGRLAGAPSSVAGEIGANDWLY